MNNETPADACLRISVGTMRISKLAKLTGRSQDVLRRMFLAHYSHFEITVLGAMAKNEKR